MDGSGTVSHGAYSLSVPSLDNAGVSSASGGTHYGNFVAESENVAGNDVTYRIRGTIVETEFSQCAFSVHAGFAEMTFERFGNVLFLDFAERDLNRIVTFFSDGFDLYYGARSRLNYRDGYHSAVGSEYLAHT